MCIISTGLSVIYNESVQFCKDDVLKYEVNILKLMFGLT